MTVNIKYCTVTAVLVAIIVAPSASRALGQQNPLEQQKSLAQQSSSSDTLFVNCAMYKEAVLAYSREIMQSRERKVAMANAVKAAGTAFLPYLSLLGQGQYRINDYTMSFAGSMLDMAHESYSVTANLSQVVYDGGAARNRYRAARIEEEIAAQNELLTRREIAYAAETAYWSAAAAKELYVTVTRYVQIISSLEELLKTRYSNGLISKTDYLQILSRLKEAQLNRSEAYKAYITALQSLNSLMGREPGLPVNLSEPINAKLPAILPANLQNVLEAREDYRIAQLNTGYQIRQLYIIKSEYNPSLSIGLQQSWGTSALNFSGNPKFNTYAFAQLNVPVFSWGARYKKAASQRAAINSAELASDKLSNDILKEVSLAWTRYTEDTGQIKIAREAVNAAIENLELNTYSYNQGKLTILDVLSSQLTWIQAHSRYIEVMLQQKLSGAAYRKATGSD